MTQKDELKAAVLSLKDDSTQFDTLALEIFKYQSKNNFVYNEYLKHLKVKVKNVTRIEQIPCLPISFFKFQDVITEPATPALTFRSSGTTGQLNSQHHVSDLPFYEYNSLKIFENFYGSIIDYHTFALLPNYLERNDSSLVYMIKSFILKSFSDKSGFYLNQTDQMLKDIEFVLERDAKRKILLIGVTFALLNLAENKEKLAFLKKYKNRIVVMETGGMKGRRKEMLREDVHEILKDAFFQNKIHSEYGMTELLSQAYAKQNGEFKTPATMKVLLREVNDPFSYLPSFKIGKQEVTMRQRGKTGGINVIDLANIDSCCFIETQDLGSFTEDYNSFRVLGRFDNSEVRGCNLLVSA